MSIETVGQLRKALEKLPDEMTIVNEKRISSKGLRLVVCGWEEVSGAGHIATFLSESQKKKAKAEYPRRLGYTRYPRFRRLKRRVLKIENDAGLY